jgi:GNAT superfamily N-acetyltransferase
MSKRYDVEPLAGPHLDAAARLLAERHARHRREWPALDPAWEELDRARELISGLIEQDGASGAFVRADGQAVAYVLGVRRTAETWGPNVWVEDAGSAGADPEALREAYAFAARRWVAEKRTSHCAVVPASDRSIIDAWFSLSFGLQHVHALRELAPTDFRPATPRGLTIRLKEIGDVHALAELGLVLPRHVNESPVFSRLTVPTLEESLAEAEADLDNQEYTEFVAEHDGGVVGTAIGCSVELSSGNTRMMRPASVFLLAHVAVLPDARGLGAGRALAEAVMAWSRDEGYEWVATDWRSTNVEANRTWAAMGFEPSFHRLHRAIV